MLCSSVDRFLLDFSQTRGPGRAKGAERSVKEEQEREERRSSDFRGGGTVKKFPRALSPTLFFLTA